METNESGLEKKLFFFSFFKQPTWCFLGGFIGFNVFFSVLLGLIIITIINAISMLYQIRYA